MYLVSGFNDGFNGFVPDSGKRLWEVPAGEVESPAVAVPDLQGDSVPDLLIATLPADQVDTHTHI